MVTASPAPACPFNRRSSFPVATSHSFTVQSLLQEARSLPSAEKLTQETQSRCPSNLRNSFPVVVAQRRMLLSWLPEARSSPPGEKATEVTSFSWPAPSPPIRKTPATGLLA